MYTYKANCIEICISEKCRIKKGMWPHILTELYHTSQKLVIAHCGGHVSSKNAHGFAVYLPVSVIDESYYTTRFARESQWINLLKQMCQNKKVTA